MENKSCKEPSLLLIKVLIKVLFNSIEPISVSFRQVRMTVGDGEGAVDLCTQRKHELARLYADDTGILCLGGLFQAGFSMLN
jgi:hypothetical protein